MSSRIDQLARLTALFTASNVRYLDRILAILLSGQEPIHSMFWTEFKKSFPVDSDNHYGQAWNALLKLRELVKEEL